MGKLKSPIKAVCKRCEKPFLQFYTAQKYCLECKKERIQEKKRKNRRRKKPKKVCLWCHSVFSVPHTVSYEYKRFCNFQCSSNFSRMKSKVLGYYMFYYSEERVAQELSKLYKLGKDYVITE